MYTHNVPTSIPAGLAGTTGAGWIGGVWWAVVFFTVFFAGLALVKLIPRRTR